MNKIDVSIIQYLILSNYSPNEITEFKFQNIAINCHFRDTNLIINRRYFKSDGAEYNSASLKKLTVNCRVFCLLLPSLFHQQRKEMSHNILVTGGSGYLRGTLLARWSSAKLPTYHKLYALMRKEEQKEAVKAYGAEPLTFNIKDDASTRVAIIENKITIVYYLIDDMTADTQVKIIEALAEVKKQTGKDVHFLQTSGAKLFSSHAGIQTDTPVADNDSGLYDLQKRSQARWEPVGKAVNINNTNHWNCASVRSEEPYLHTMSCLRKG